MVLDGGNAAGDAIPPANDISQAMEQVARNQRPGLWSMACSLVGITSAIAAAVLA